MTGLDRRDQIDEDVFERGRNHPDTQRLQPGARERRGDSRGCGLAIGSRKADVGPVAKHLHVGHAAGGGEHIDRRLRGRDQHLDESVPQPRLRSLGNGSPARRGMRLN